MNIPQLSPAEARERQRTGALFIDVREANERATGMAEGARGVSMGALIDQLNDHAE